MKKDKLIASALAFTLTFTGCGNNNSYYSSNEYYIIYNTTSTSETIKDIEDEVIEIDTEESIETKENIITTDIMENIETEEINTTESNESKEIYTTTTENTQVIETKETVEITEEVLDEEELIEILENQEQLIMNEAVNGDKESLKNKLDEYFTLTIGFLFCDQPIKGKTLDELTTATKIKIISITNNINDVIEIYYPDYKITIKEKYTDVKVWTLDKFKSASDLIKEKLEEKLGTENYNKLYSSYESAKTKIKDITSTTLDTLGDLKDAGIQKIKDWWNSKNNNQ